MRAAVNEDGVLGAPSVGTWYPRIGLGAPLHPGDVIGVLHRAGSVLEVAAPRGAGGVATSVEPLGQDGSGPIRVVVDMVPQTPMVGRPSGSARAVADVEEGQMEE